MCQASLPLQRALALAALVVLERRIGTGEVDVARKGFLDPVARSAAGVVEDRAAGLGEHLTEVRHRLCCAVDPSPVIVADPIHYILRPPAGAAIPVTAVAARTLFRSIVTIDPSSCWPHFGLVSGDGMGPRVAGPLGKGEPRRTALVRFVL